MRKELIMKPDKKYVWIFWQYSNRKKIDGIKAYGDGNVFSGNKDDFFKLF